MKLKKSQKKLCLSKVTISDLTSMRNARGGVITGRVPCDNYSIIMEDCEYPYIESEAYTMCGWINTNDTPCDTIAC